ncbi:HAD family hydrolase [Alphaproteobacteria bacterium]|nr:HAD family hydrolase [Alphaproteobacteria bacterium]
MMHDNIPKIEIFVFDFDGTIVDTAGLKRDTFLEVSNLASGGQKVMEKTLSEVAGDRHKIFKHWAKSLNKGNQYAAKYCSIYTNLVDNRVTLAPEITGSIQLVKSLKQNGKWVFISSATPIQSLDSILRKRGWFDLFHESFGSPNSKIETLQNEFIPRVADPKKICVIGDGIDDYESAESCGCEFIPVEITDTLLNLGMRTELTLDKLQQIIKQQYLN